MTASFRLLWSKRSLEFGYSDPVVWRLHAVWWLAGMLTDGTLDVAGACGRSIS